MKHRVYTALLLLLGLGLASCDDTPLTDLSLRSLEVTQDTPKRSNTAYRSSQRRTTIRAILMSDVSYDITGVVGMLSVSVDGLIVITNKAAANGPVTVPTGGKASLDFILDAPTGISASHDVDLFVTLSAPSQFLEGEAFDLTFGAQRIVANEGPALREASRPAQAQP